MLEQLLNLVKEHAGDEIINNPAIPNERNDEAISEVAGGLMNGLQSALAGGQGAGLLRMLGGRDSNLTSNPLFGQLQGGLVNQLASKFGLDGHAASGIVGNMLPGLMNSLISKTNNPADNSFSLDGILGSLTGGQAAGMDLSGLMSKVSGGAFDNDGDGDTDMQDIMGALSGGAAKAQQSSGGLLDTLKGMFS
jgi:hypothetical protein